MAVDSILNYLQLIAKARGAKPEGLQFYPEEFLLKYGQEFSTFEGTLAGPRMLMKNCYGNCYDLATRNWGRGMADNGLTYCEGFVQSVIPVRHAWLIDKEGRVIDPTLRPRLSDDIPEPAYFGVPFQTKYLINTTLANGYYGLLDAMLPENQKLYLGEVKPEAALVMQLIAKEVGSAEEA